MKVCELNTATLILGRQGENDVEVFYFDFSEWVSEFGSGTIHLYNKRSGDSAAYPVNLEVNGSTAAWTLSDTDTARVGFGEAQLVYTVNEKVKKSIVFQTRTLYSLSAGDPPDPYEDWLDQLTAIADEAMRSAESASTSAENASESEGKAKTSEENASASEGNALTYRNQAQGYAQDAAGSATAAEGHSSDAEGYASQASGYASDAERYAEQAEGAVRDTISFSDEDEGNVVITWR